MVVVPRTRFKESADVNLFLSRPFFIKRKGAWFLCPTHAHVAQILHTANLDHIVYFPSQQHPPRFRVYLSLIHFHCLIVPLTATAPTSVEMSNVYTWALANRHQLAYRYPCLSLLAPAPNRSNRTAKLIADWCDTQIDAFMWFYVTTACCQE